MKVVHWRILLLLDLQALENSVQHIVVPPDMSVKTCRLRGSLWCELSRPYPLGDSDLLGYPVHRSGSPCFEITFHESYFLFVPLL